LAEADAAHPLDQLTDGYWVGLISVYDIDPHKETFNFGDRGETWGRILGGVEVPN
jgi:hypothetical protein